MADGLTPFKSRLAKKKAIRALPKYVRYRQTEMRLWNPEENAFLGWDDLKVEYHRDAGSWSLDFKIVDGKTYSLDDVELVPISYVEWKKGNAGYISNKTKAYSI